MDFNSLVYLGFFCAVAAVNYLLPKAARPWLLLVASYAFYLYDPAMRSSSLCFSAPPSSPGPAAWLLSG